MQSDPKYLYHGTGIYCLAAIIHSDSLEEGVHWGKPGEPHGPRLTADYDIAKSFITYNIHWGEGGIIVLDHQALAADYSLVEYRDKGYDGNDFGRAEREVAVIAPAIKPLSKYMVSVICAPEVIKMAIGRQNMEDAFTECGWVNAWGSPHRSPGRQKMMRAFDALTASPFLNANTLGLDVYPTIGNWIDSVATEQPSHGSRP